jgi:hypothetical protein
VGYNHTKKVPISGRQWFIHQRKTIILTQKQTAVTSVGNNICTVSLQKYTVHLFVTKPNSFYHWLHTEGPILWNWQSLSWSWISPCFTGLEILPCSQILYAFLIFPMLVTCRAHFILLYMEHFPGKTEAPRSLDCLYRNPPTTITTFWMTKVPGLWTEYDSILTAHPNTQAIFVKSCVCAHVCVRVHA